MSGRYKFTARDGEFLWAADMLLKKVAESRVIRPAQMVTVAKLQHVLSVLPRVTEGLCASVSVVCPRHSFGDVETCHWWDFGIEDGELRASSGGHFHRPTTGGDTFTTMVWEAVPGFPTELDDHRDSLQIVPDVRSFSEGIEAIDFTSETYSVRILDNDNPLLEADEDSNDHDDGNDEDEIGEIEDGSDSREGETSLEQLLRASLNPAGERLAALVDPDLVNAKDPTYASNVENCDYCGCVLDQQGLYVDGRLRESLTWGNMCPVCFEALGEGVGWGKGQLYARQPNGDWLLVAGFVPENG